MSSRFQIGVFALATAAIGGVGVGMAQSGCTVLTNDAPPDDATFEGGNEASVPACNDCVAQQCLGQWSVCFSDEGCRSIRACAAGGGDKVTCACSSTATAQDGGADPIGAYIAFAACNDAKTCNACSTDCSSTCANGAPSTSPETCGGKDAGTDSGFDAGVDSGEGGTPDAGPPADAAPPPPTVDGCTNCINGACNDPKQACATGTECAAYLSCTFACTDTACQDTCATNHATGVESARELSGCAITSCASACGF
jgi:hypothetical protein